MIRISPGGAGGQTFVGDERQFSGGVARPSRFARRAGLLALGVVAVAAILLAIVRLSREREALEAPHLIVSVTDFGARGDGTADDTGAIQRALDAAEGRGMTVLFPAGTYLVRAAGTLSGADAIPGQTTHYALHISKGSIALTGANATIRLADAQPAATALLLIGGDNAALADVRVAGLGFDGNGQRQGPQSGIFAGVFVLGTAVRDVHLDQIHVADVKVPPSQAAVTFHRSVSDSSLTDSLVETSSGAGVFLDGGTRILVSDNLIRDTGSHGIAAQANADNLVAVRSCAIVDNTIVRPGRDAPATSHGIAFNGEDSVVAGNQVTMGGSGSGWSHGILVTAYTSPKGTYPARGNTISGNTVIGGYFGIALTGLKDPLIWTSDSVVATNHLEGKPLRGIDLGPATTRITVSNNLIDAAIVPAVDEEAGSTANVIRDNRAP